MKWIELLSTPRKSLYWIPERQHWLSVEDLMGSDLKFHITILAEGFPPMTREAVIKGAAKMRLMEEGIGGYYGDAGAKEWIPPEVDNIDPADAAEAFMEYYGTGEPAPFATLPQPTQDILEFAAAAAFAWKGWDQYPMYRVAVIEEGYYSDDAIQILEEKYKRIHVVEDRWQKVQDLLVEEKVFSGPVK